MYLLHIHLIHLSPKIAKCRTSTISFLYYHWTLNWTYLLRKVIKGPEPKPINEGNFLHKDYSSKKLFRREPSSFSIVHIHQQAFYNLIYKNRKLEQLLIFRYTREQDKHPYFLVFHLYRAPSFSDQDVGILHKLFF